MPRGNGEATRRNLNLDRFKFWLIGWIGYCFIKTIGRTIRWESEGDSYLDEIYKSGRRAIFTFWHGRIFPATYYWRDRGIVVMTSMNRDGEPIAQCIQRFGYSAARGVGSALWPRWRVKSARGAIRLLRSMGLAGRGTLPSKAQCCSR